MDEKTNRIEDFQAGYFQKMRDFKAFIPSCINKEWIWNNPKINVLLERANQELGKLEMYSQRIPNIDLYIQMHISIEANKSSKIEGTKTTIEEDLIDIEDLVPEKRDDQQEVKNYIEAMNHGINRIKDDQFPISTRLIKEIHEKLLSGVRGERKFPGTYRTSQNWIGGSKPSDAKFVPPPADELNMLLSDLENFLHNEEIYVPHLIKIAILHYQFETIHPFLDGNGRVGRLIIPLYLLSNSLLSNPCFYISNYLEKNRVQYYEALDRVRYFNDLSGWLIFFLEAVIETAQVGRETFEKVLAIVDKHNDQLTSLRGNKENLKALFKAFYATPILTITKVAELIDVAYNTARNLITTLLAAGIVEEYPVKGSSHNHYVMSEYVLIFTSK